jgi:hypothetical protein
MKAGEIFFDPANRLHLNVERSKGQTQRDAHLITELLYEGHPLARIPELLRKKTGENYTLLYSQVASVVQDAFRIWWDASTKDTAAHLIDEIARIEMVEQEAWKCHYEAKSGVRISTTDWAFLDEETTFRENPKHKTSGKVKRITGIGKDTFLGLVLKCIDMRCKLYMEIAKLGNTDGFADVIQVEFIRANRPNR